MALSLNQLNQEIDPFRQLQREVRLKQLRIDDLAQVNTYHSGIIKGQMKLIDKTRQEYKTLSLKYERVLKENDLLRAELLEECECKRGIDEVMGSSNQEIPKHEIKLVAQKKDTKEELRVKIAIAFAKEQLVDDMRKWEVDLCPPQEHQVAEQPMTKTQSKQTTNLEVKVGPKQVETEEPVVYNISDCIFRKKCFDDEEIVEDEVDEDIEKLIIETYSKKVTFDEDVEETEFVEEELEAENKDGGLGAEEGDTVANLDKVPTPQEEEEEEEEEFLSTDDEDEDVAEEQNEEVTIVGEIGQFRKKTFDDEEVIDEVDPEVELMIIRTYATFVSFDGEEE